ncbi:thiol-disulfide oxidoreductase DCC family protein [Spiribacter insolitus]|uniref:DUF393 domain-containing protein n=1 Tax=Spiribacter insolitus TaxID=3122417 RepID=A0ABV3T5I5_9GAMM
MATKRLYYDGSCGMCRREIEHLRGRLEPELELVDISAPAFEPPAGYTFAAMMERIHLHDGERMQVGLPASLVYWRMAGGGFRLLAGLLSLPGVFALANRAYNRWAAWRLRGRSCSA